MMDPEAEPAKAKTETHSIPKEVGEYDFAQGFSVVSMARRFASFASTLAGKQNPTGAVHRPMGGNASRATHEEALSV